jgi:hypothetical protein
MTDRLSGSRARTRARTPLRVEKTQQDSRRNAPRTGGPQSPLTAAAHITLGVALSCLGGMLAMGLLAGAVLAFLYVTK